MITIIMKVLLQIKYSTYLARYYCANVMEWLFVVVVVVVAVVP